MELVSIGVGSHTLNSDATASFARMVTAGMPTGTINTSTRSYALQSSWYKNQGKAGYPKYADHPDRSKHVWRPDAADKGARALDVATNSPMHAWLLEHGNAHGWFRRISVEPWHWEYESQHDTNATASTNRKKAKMLHFSVNDKSAPRGTRYVILMPDGRRADYRSGTDDFPVAVAAQIGKAIGGDEAVIASIQKQLRDSGPAISANVAIDYAKLAAEFAKVTPAAQDNSEAVATKTANKIIAWFKR